MNKNPHLVSAQPVIEKWMRDPNFQKAYEEEYLKIQIAQSLLQHRKSKKLSQSSLAQKANTTQKVISRIENGEVSVGVDLLQRIAGALGMRVEVRFV